MSNARRDRFVSLRRFLDADPVAAARRQGQSGAEPLLRLASGLIEAIEQYVLCGAEHSALHAELRAATSQLSAEISLDETATLGQAITRILAQYSSAAQRKSANVTIEVQNILGILNQTLMSFASGSERSGALLHRIQEKLQQTAQAKDLNAVKTGLAQTMQFVREESLREQQASSKELADLESELGRARRFATASRASLQGRPEGVRHIRHEIAIVPSELALYLLAYRFDRLEAMAQRYGVDAAEELIFRVISERVQPLATSSVSFRWTSSSLVAAFQRARDLPRVVAEAAALNRTPLQYRLPLGSRTALLTIQPSHLVGEAEGDSPDPLIAEVDAFTGARV